jgi:hypothetical protein
MLWDWFRSRRGQDEPQGEWWTRLRRLENDMEQLQLSWEETYGKVRRALATLAKRQAREEAATEPEPEAPSANGAPQPPSPSLYQELRRMYGRH